MSEQVTNGSATTSTTATDLESYQKFALEQQAANNAWSAEQAQKQMDFQKEMSNTSHQREVADLKAAGLNPILSANSGASVGNGSMAEPDRSAAGNVGQILQQVLQAQSAREVAAMYNAATINAAQIAASASMYGSDMSYWNREDHPSSLQEAAAYALYQAQNGSHAPGSGSSPHDNVYSGLSGNSGSSVSGSMNNAQQGLAKSLNDIVAKTEPSNWKNNTFFSWNKQNQQIWNSQVWPALQRKYSFLRNNSKWSNTLYTLWRDSGYSGMAKMINYIMHTFGGSTHIREDKSAGRRGTF